MNSPPTPNVYETFEDLTCSYEDQLDLPPATPTNFGKRREISPQLNFILGKSMNWKVLSWWSMVNDPFYYNLRGQPFRGVEKGNEFRDWKSCFNFLSPVKHFRNNWPIYTFFKYLESAFRDIIVYGYQSYDLLEFTKKRTILFLNLLNPKHGHEPRQFDLSMAHNLSRITQLMEEELVDCSYKTAFIAESNVLRGEMIYLKKHYPRLKWNVGKEKFGSWIKAWTFVSCGNSRVPFYMKALTENGIYGRLVKEADARRHLYRVPAISERIVASMKMDNAFISLLLLSSAVLALGFLSFVVESRWVVLNVAGCMVTVCFEMVLTGCKAVSKKSIVRGVRVDK